jgi:hypothetical protein
MQLYNYSSYWCLAFIEFTSSGQIAIQSWSGSYTKQWNAVSDYLYLGSLLWPICVGTNVITHGQYSGLLDEFSLFTRDLTSVEVYQLVNP